MFNRKKLVRLFLSEIHSERSYLDFKECIDLTSTPGKGKILRLISAMSNSHVGCKAFIVVGVEDTSKQVVTVPYLDDFHLQNILKEYLHPVPDVVYENVPYPNSDSSSYIGLITIYPKPCSFKKDIWKIKKGDVFVRIGSVTEKNNDNEISISPFCQESKDLEAQASISLEDYISEVSTFMTKTGESYSPKYKVFNDKHVICYSGWNGEWEEEPDLMSEVYIVLIPESIRFFWSALEHVKIHFTNEMFIIEKYIMLFWNKKRFFVPYTQTTIQFSNEGNYTIQSELTFDIPEIPKDELEMFISSYQQKQISDYNMGELEILPYELLIASLNGSELTKKGLFDRLNGRADGVVAESFSDAQKILCEVESKIIEDKSFSRSIF